MGILSIFFFSFAALECQFRKKLPVCTTTAVLLVNLAGFDVHVYVSSNDDYCSQNVQLELDRKL